MASYPEKKIILWRDRHVRRRHSRQVLNLEAGAESRVRSSVFPLSSATASAVRQKRRSTLYWRNLFQTAVLTGGAGGGLVVAGSTGAAELGVGP